MENSRECVQMIHLNNCDHLTPVNNFPTFHNHGRSHNEPEKLPGVSFRFTVLQKTKQLHQKH